MGIDRKQVESIVEKVLEGLSLSSQSTSTTKSNVIVDGVFQEMEGAIQGAVVAHQELVSLPLAVREKIIQAIRDVGWANRQEYGQMELEEAELGAVDGTVLKLETACGVPGIEDLAPEVYTGDRGITINERVPVGVIASVNAVTNAAPGIIHNAIMMLAGGNTVVNNPHPKTKIVSARVVRDVNKAIIEAGGPPNCMTTVEEPDVPTAQYLMTHPQVNMIAVTGGHRVVEFATRTGKRVIAGGPGNPPVVVDETADLENAAKCIIRGASFSNCTPCSSEKEIFVVESVADRLKELLIKNGAYELSIAQGEALMKEIFNEIRPGRVPSVINMDYIGKPPHVILQKAIKLDVPPETKIAILETDKEHPLIWTEQIMPVLPFVRCRDAEDAMTMGVAAEQGMRHTIVFHSNDLNNLARMSSMADASQFVKNGSSIGGLGVEGEGFKSLHIATGGEGLTRPKIFTQVRRCVLTDDFRYRFGAEEGIQRPQ
jgi:acyl-CoA reductase-like NAD-dependent aldehyde dehydrogenase